MISSISLLMFLPNSTGNDGYNGSKSPSYLDHTVSTNVTVDVKVSGVATGFSGGL